TSVTPACDTIPVPSAVTRKPFSQPVVFTYQVLLDLGPDKDVDTLIVPGQEHFLWLPRRSAHTRREFSGLAHRARWGFTAPSHSGSSPSPPSSATRLRKASQACGERGITAQTEQIPPPC